jgi:hypothetical protein
MTVLQRAVGETMKEMTMSGMLGSFNDIRYTLRADIKIQLGEDGEGYPQASYAPLELKVGDLTEEKAVDSLKRKIIVMYEHLVTNQVHADDPTALPKREHLLRLVERNVYDPRESLETVVSK